MKQKIINECFILKPHPRPTPTKLNKLHCKNCESPLGITMISGSKYILNF